MLNAHHVLLYLLAVLAINLLPGPDMLYVITRSIGQGRKAGLAAVFGIASGCMVHTLAAALGLSLLLLQSALIFSAVKYLGAGYLIYLGIKTLNSKNTLTVDNVESTQKTIIQNYTQGLITTVLNPKVALFFVAFLPQFVVATDGNVILQMILLGIIFIFSGTLINAAIACFFGTAKFWLSTKPHLLQIQQKVTGFILIGLGLRLATLHRS
jgi:threonine/homoserine/homoserine lactone efflux protein